MITSEGVLKIRLRPGAPDHRDDQRRVDAGRRADGTLHYIARANPCGFGSRSDILPWARRPTSSAYKQYSRDAPACGARQDPPQRAAVLSELEPELAKAHGRRQQGHSEESRSPLRHACGHGVDLTCIRDHLIAQDATVQSPFLNHHAPRDRPGIHGRCRRGGPSRTSKRSRSGAARRRPRSTGQAQEFFDAQDYQATIDQCEQAAVVDPMTAGSSRCSSARTGGRQAGRPVVERAQALLTQGLLSDADRLIDESLQRRPNSAEAQALQQQVRTRRREQERAAERERAAQSAVARARVNLDEGALEAAIRCATEALAHDPGREDALALKARAQSALAERQKKEELEERAHEAVANARDLAAGEALDEALRSLRAFEPAHSIVEEAIAELEAEAAARERRRREEEEERKRQRAAESTAARRRAARARRGSSAASRGRGIRKPRAAQAEQRFADALDALIEREVVPDDSEIDSMIAAVTQERHDAEAAERRQRTGSAGHGRAASGARRAGAAQRLVSAALEAHEHPTALQLQERARAMLEEQRRAGQLKRQATAAAGAARRLFVTGDYPGAVRLLEAFAPRELVESVLQEIHTEWRRQEQRRAEADERKRLEEEAAHAALEAQQRGEAEARAEAERVERERVAAEKAAAEAAAADEQRRLDDERKRAEAQARAEAENAERERAAAAKAAG